MNTDLEELLAYNLSSIRKTCDHSASVLKQHPDSAGYAAWCPDCKARLSFMDSFKWSYFRYLMEES